MGSKFHFIWSRMCLALHGLNLTKSEVDHALIREESGQFLDICKGGHRFIAQLPSCFLFIYICNRALFFSISVLLCLWICISVFLYWNRLTQWRTQEKFSGVVQGRGSGLVGPLGGGPPPPNDGDFSKICRKSFLRKLPKMHYFSIFFEYNQQPCVNFARVWTKNTNCFPILVVGRRLVRRHFVL